MSSLDPRFLHKQILSPAGANSVVMAITNSPIAITNLTTLISNIMGGGGSLAIRNQLAFVSVESSRRELVVVENSAGTELFSSYGDPVLGLQVKGSEQLMTSTNQPIVSHV